MQSGEIYKGRNLSLFRSHPGTKIEMRAVASWIKVGHEHADVKHSDSQTAKFASKDVRKTDRSGGLNAIGGPGVVAGPFRVVAGPNVGLKHRPRQRAEHQPLHRGHPHHRHDR
ncbi:hypothetical protein [Saccharopolyspora gregorii]|uniref:Uncharacterized protein n=1 Tax=Saccharopolyspora gregorii TaxID=33914 RepID=A0ABP6S3B3_9PSEU